MKIRIIAGRYRKLLIEAPQNELTHPMGERIRNALFNIVGSEIDNAQVLDAFSGTGALGLEALSRGASHATFIERDREAQTILARNIASLGAGDQTKVVNSSVSQWLDTVKDQRFDVILADPPYDDTQFSTVTRLFALLKPNGLMVLSYPGRGEAPTEAGVVVVDNRSYGTAALTFYRLDNTL